MRSLDLIGLYFSNWRGETGERGAQGMEVAVDKMGKNPVLY